MVYFNETISNCVTGLEQKIDSLGQLKVKGLVVGPIHYAPADSPVNLDFEQISPEAGNLEQFKSLIQAAHKKSESFLFVYCNTLS